MNKWIYFLALQLTPSEEPAIAAQDPLNDTSDTAPLRGNIQSSSSSSRGNQFTPGYLTSSIPGEDRRAPQNTIDESVWDTVSRDLLAVWEKLRQVLYPKYLIGGILQRGGGGIGAAERGEAGGFGQALRGLVGRWPDAEVVLQGGMSEGLRDWDLWYAHGQWTTFYFFFFFFFVFRRLIYWLILTLFQGSAYLLLASEYVSVDARKRRTIFAGIFRSLLYCMDWRSRGYATDQIAGRKYVRFVSSDNLFTWI